MQATRDRVEREIEIEAPLETVWDVLTDPRQTKLWLCDEAEFEARAGAVGSVGWHEYGSYEIVVDAAERPYYFAFRWVHPQGEAPAVGNSLLVEFRLAASGARTRLHVTESGFSSLPSESDARHTPEDHDAGWTKHLSRLREVVETSRTVR